MSKTGNTQNTKPKMAHKAQLLKLDLGDKSTRAGEIDAESNRLFLKLPDAYADYAAQWLMYTTWSIEEAANLLSGCVPHRPMLNSGQHHRVLDDEVLETENKIRRALGKSLQGIKTKKYFSTVSIDSKQLIQWAMDQTINLPEALVLAYHQHQQQASHGYTTPALEAIEWVKETYWQDADFRDPPNAGEIIQAILRQFPVLDGQACEMIEYVCRHPLARTPTPEGKP